MVFDSKRDYNKVDLSTGGTLMKNTLHFQFEHNTLTFTAESYIPAFKENADFWRLHLDFCQVGKNNELGVYSHTQVPCSVKHDENVLTVYYDNLIAEDGYTFDHWSDGIVTPARVDKGITKDISVTAIFSKVDDLLPEDDGDGDEPDDIPPKGENMSSDSSAGGAGKYEVYNQFIDGKTYYRELLEIYREDILDYLDKYGSELTPEEREIIESYIGIV